MDEKTCCHICLGCVSWSLFSDKGVIEVSDWEDVVVCVATTPVTDAMARKC